LNHLQIHIDSATKALNKNAIVFLHKSKLAGINPSLKAADKAGAHVIAVRLIGWCLVRAKGHRDVAEQRDVDGVQHDLGGRAAPHLARASRDGSING